MLVRLEGEATLPAVAAGQTVRIDTEVLWGNEWLPVDGSVLCDVLPHQDLSPYQDNPPTAIRVIPREPWENNTGYTDRVVRDISLEPYRLGSIMLRNVVVPPGESADTTAPDS